MPANLWGIIRNLPFLWHKLWPSPPLSQAGLCGGRCADRAVMDEPFCALWPHRDRLFLQDIRENDLGHAAARPHLLAQSSTVCCSGWIWEWHLVILLKVRSPPRPLLHSGDFKIKEAIHHLQHVMLRPYRERKGKWRARGGRVAFSGTAFICQLEISISHKRKTPAYKTVLFALSGSCLMDN